MTTNNTSPAKKSAFEKFMSANKYNITFFSLIAASLATGGLLVEKLYDTEKSNLRDDNDKLSYENERLSQILKENEKRIDTLNSKVDAYRSFIENNPVSRQPASVGAGRSKVSTVSLPTTTIAPPIQQNNEFEQKITDLQNIVDSYAHQYSALSEENDELKSKLNLYREKLVRARKLELQRLEETNHMIQLEHSKNIAKILFEVENGINALGLAQPVVPPKTDTVFIVERTTITDYEKSGDAFLKQANADYQTLLAQPNRVWLSKNRTKEAFILSTLNNYNTALENYKLAKTQSKIASTEKRIQEFKKEFGLQ